jgi:hypothetical protein
MTITPGTCLGRCDVTSWTVVGCWPPLAPPGHRANNGDVWSAFAAMHLLRPDRAGGRSSPKLTGDWSRLALEIR